MIHVDEEDLRILQSILAKYPYTFYAFGSRVKGTHWPFSDLDLCYKDYIRSDVFVDLEEDLRESDLPFKVDIVDWNAFTSDFQKEIVKDLEMVPRN
jgi:predicted nucleotidyltransferase